MKRIFRVIIVIITFSFINVKANSINSIDMDIYIDNNGNADITEEWDASLDSGTEGYHPYFNIGNSSITFNSVSDDLGNSYTYNSNWDVNDGFDGKKNSFGIYIDNGEYDLCWGIGEYGNRRYILNYTINNFIYNTSDGYQILYWTLIPKGMSSSVGRVNIKVHGDNKFNSDLPVYGYGNYGGRAYVYDGVVEMTSPNDGINSKQYMTLLVRFNSNSFNTSNSINKSWSDIYKESKEGARKSNLELYIWLGIFLIIFIFIVIPYIITMFIIKRFINSNEKKLINKDKLEDVNIYRDIPFGDDYFYANYIVQEYGLVNSNSNILGAMFLKWIKNGNISVRDDDFIINNNVGITGDEMELWDIIKNVSINNVLKKKRFKEYCRENYSDFYNWFSKVYEDSFSKLDDDKRYIISREKKTLFGVKYEFIPTDRLNGDARMMAGLKLFFKNFGSIHDKNLIQVKQWRNYLIYAQILGMAKSVAREFKNLYPDIITDDYYGEIVFVDDFSSSLVGTISDAAASEYSSGGGGSSFGDGGGGSFGGGGTGGGFR